MNREDILNQCLEWKKELDKENKGACLDKKIIKYNKAMENFTKRHSRKVGYPKYEVFDIAKATNHDLKRYPIFFIRERQIFQKEDGLTWVYFGSLFNIQDEKVCYQTTTSFIPEKYIKPFN